LVDIFSVVLVEQFWSLTNTIYSTEEGKRWYGIVGSGGLVGGVVVGIAARFMLQTVGLHTPDLLLVAAAIHHGGATDCGCRWLAPTAAKPLPDAHCGNVAAHPDGRSPGGISIYQNGGIDVHRIGSTDVFFLYFFLVS
jgi:hypothetical protein